MIGNQGNAPTYKRFPDKASRESNMNEELLWVGIQDDKSGLKRIEILQPIIGFWLGSTVVALPNEVLSCLREFYVLLPTVLWHSSTHHLHS